MGKQYDIKPRIIKKTPGNLEHSSTPEKNTSVKLSSQKRNRHKIFTIQQYCKKMGVRIGKTVGFWRTDSQQNLYIESILKDMQKSQIAYDRIKS